MHEEVDPLIEWNNVQSRSCWEVLTEDMQIRYDGVLQGASELYDIKARNEYVWLEYSNMVLGTLVYPFIPIFLWSFMVTKDEEEPYCFTGNLLPYFVVLVFESIFFGARAYLFIKTLINRNGTYKTQVYNQMGGLWVDVQEPIGFVLGQFMKDVVAGLGIFFMHADIYSNIVSVMVMLHVYEAAKAGVARGPLVASTLVVILIVMAVSTLLHMIPRLICIVCVPLALSRSVEIEQSSLLRRFGQVEMSRLDDSNDAIRFKDIKQVLRNQLVANLFNFGENTFVPLLFPPDVSTLSAEQVKYITLNKMRIGILKVVCFSAPQTICQYRYTVIMKAFGCVDTSDFIIYISLAMSVGLGVYNLLDVCLNFMRYRDVEAKMFVNKYIKGSSNKKRPTILAESLTHEDFKYMAEYYLKHPHAFEELNVEKGVIAGYNKDIKIIAPKNLDKTTTFNVRINFCQGYVKCATKEDQQIVVNFVGIFPKVRFSKGLGYHIPAELEEQFRAMENVVEFTSGF